MPESGSLRFTSLHEAHRACGARLVPFAGFDMPVQYQGIILEAKAVRTSCGMFDVSHMGRLKFKGDGSQKFLDSVTTNAVSALPLSAGHYSLIPNERGGSVDDIILYRLRDEYQMVVNASNHEKAVSWLSDRLPADVAITDQTDETAMIAVQGPDAADILSRAIEHPEALTQLAAFGVANVLIRGIAVQAARSGYTGEDGFELICSAQDSVNLWNVLLELGVTPCGLGARDTLRVEAGLPLYGHELTDVLSPVAAGLGWVISKEKEFTGSDIIAAVRAAGPAQRLVGIRLEVKRLISPDMHVKVDGAQVGYVTSGIVSPTFDTALALAYVDKNVALGTPCQIALRGKDEDGTVVSKRFYKRTG